jgi:phosphatidylinositol glycan class T
MMLLFLSVSMSVLIRHANLHRHAAQHYSLFPLALGQILRTHAVAEMHLTLNAGRWRYDDWGTPPPVTDEEVDTGSLGTGGELRAWFAEGGPTG